MRPQAGLCDRCVHQRIIRTTRGSTFSMCGKHKEDARFAKYPPIPVARCPGFARREAAGSG